ncbi:MAG: NUDIX hydrolase [Firmicutes bacterium]|nr:NUDIX hydrolase [Bacillota bacterium]
MKIDYTSDLLIFGIDSRVSSNVRSLPKKYFSILLVKRNKEPFNNKWCLPGGYVNSNETSKEAAIRILEKETSLKNVYMQQVGVYDSVDRDPRGRTVSSSYMALIDRSILNQDLSNDAAWFDIEIVEKDDVINVKLINEDIIDYDVKKITIDKKTNEYEYEVISNNDLAFDHAEIIIKGIMDLRNKVNNTDIVFNLMPEEFTIGELKQVYSLLLGKELVNSAFRRVIAPKIVETGKMISTGGHRPSMLCKYKEGDK